jgi:hypothetical protein
MRGRRKAALVVLGIVLFVALLSANVVVTLDRTAFDADYAKESAEEAGLYESLATRLRSEVRAQAPEDAGQLPIDRSMGELFASAITDEYVRSQGERNIENVYAYLNGESDELRVGLDTGPIEQRILEEVETEVEDLDLAAMDMPFGAEIEAMASNRSAFEERRTAFREEQKARIQARTDRDLSEEELETRLNESMGEIRDRMLSGLDSQLDGQFEGPASELEGPVRDLQTARIDALTGAITYEEYTTQVETARDDLGDAIVGIFEARLDEQLPETIDVTEQMGPQQLETLETARTAVSLSTPVAIGLSVLAVAFAALVAWLAPYSIAAIEIGVVSALVGAAGVAGSFVATGQLRSALGGGTNAPEVMTEFALTLLVGVFEALTVQSAVLLVVGVGLTAVGLALQFGYLDLGLDSEQASDSESDSESGP